MDYSIIAFATLALCAGATGAAFRPGAWYESLRKPGWTPPNWVFPLVWTILYVMIAVAGSIVWQAQGLGLAVMLWIVQIVLNGAWSWLFFGLKRMDLAFIDVVLLALSVAAFIVAAWPVSQNAALLFVPYLVWVVTAAALNFTVWTMNSREPRPSQA